MKFILATIGICIVGAAIALKMFGNIVPPTPATESPTTSQDTIVAASTTPLTAKDFAWSVAEAPNYDETAPNQNVSLVVKGKTYSLGTFMGCGLTNPAIALEPHEITRETCWFAGGGNDLSVFEDNGSYIVKKRWTQESGGPEVHAAPYGPFEIVLTL